MALTSTTTFDLVGQTQTIVFNNPSHIDEIDFGSNQITWDSQSGFNLARSDLILYLQFLNVYANLLVTNFPSVQNSRGVAFPLCLFTLSETFAGVTHINFIQSSQGNAVNTINYLPSITSASFASRSSVTISLQEFFFSVQMLNQYAIQIGLN
jgi:hypothetical protein